MTNRVRVNDIDIRYDIAGEGPWVILSHSLASDLALWEPQMSALTQRFKVLRFDTRGHGGSSAPNGPYDFAMLTGDVLGLMDLLGVDTVRFVGISLGGMIGQHLALDAPERVEKLVLVSTTSGYGHEAKDLWAARVEAVRLGGMGLMVGPTLERWFTPGYRAMHPDVMAAIGGQIRLTPAAGYIGCGLAIPTMNADDRLDEIVCRTLVIAGAQDTGTPPAMGRKIAERVRDARFELIESAAHLCNVEQADAFSRLLLEFL
jgi:3-oxoadipate enol-lactonase